MVRMQAGWWPCCRRWVLVDVVWPLRLQPLLGKCAYGTKNRSLPKHNGEKRPFFFRFQTVEYIGAILFKMGCNALALLHRLQLTVAFQ